MKINTDVVTLLHRAKLATMKQDLRKLKAIKKELDNTRQSNYLVQQ